jgi:hypothetical protein
MEHKLYTRYLPSLYRVVVELKGLMYKTKLCPSCHISRTNRPLKLCGLESKCWDENMHRSLQKLW